MLGQQHGLVEPFAQKWSKVTVTTLCNTNRKSMSIFRSFWPWKQNLLNQKVLGPKFSQTFWAFGNTPIWKSTFPIIPAPHECSIPPHGVSPFLVSSRFRQQPPPPPADSFTHFICSTFVPFFILICNSVLSSVWHFVQSLWHCSRFNFCFFQTDGRSQGHGEVSGWGW